MERVKKLISTALILCIMLFLGNIVLRKLYPLDYIDIITENAEKHNLDPLFIISVIHAESRFNPDATSHKEAKGLMQLRDDTAVWCAYTMNYEGFSADEIYDPQVNIMIGVWYLDYLLDRFDGNYTLCLASYNAGMGNVSKWLDNPKYSADKVILDKIPFPETERYIKKVMNNYAIYKMLYNKSL